MRLKSIKSIQVKGKKVLIRTDFNVPIKDSQILDTSRIKAVLPTIKYLIKQKAKAILISHLGDPKTAPSVQCRLTQINILSLKPIYQYLKKSGLKIKFVDDCIGLKVKKVTDKMKPGEIILLENLRFYPSEKKNDLKFAKQLASLADIYVNEAFSVSHRNHASVAAVTKFLPSYAGFLLEKEVKALSEILEKPKHPLIVVIGGAKISTKIGVIKNLAKKADLILIGGALANNFFAAAGYPISQSKYESEMIGLAKNLLDNKKIVLPRDVVIKFQIPNPKLQTNSNIQILKIKELDKFADKNFQILDIGTETIKLFSKHLKSAKMVVWNGPMGYSEEKSFAEGTIGVIKAIMATKKAQIVVGGGETIAALRQLRIKNYESRIKNIFVSMGGGAMLEFLEGRILPGLKPLFK